MQRGGGTEAARFDMSTTVVCATCIRSTRRILHSFYRESWSDLYTRRMCHEVQRRWPGGASARMHFFLPQWDRYKILGTVTSPAAV